MEKFINLKYMEYSGQIVVFVLIAFVCILLFLAFRALFLWYWRIDTVVQNQEEQIVLLKQILEQSRILKAGTEIDLKP